MLRAINCSIILLSLLTVAQAQKTCVSSRAELEIYRVVLKSTHDLSIVDSRPEHTPAAIFDLGPRQLQDATAGWTPRLEAAPAGTVTILASPPRDFTLIPVASRKEIQQDYERKLAQSCRIPQIGITSVKVLEESQLVARAAKNNSNDPSLYWRWFHKRFGAKASRTALSRVAFDKSMNFAVVHVSSGISEHGAGGMLYVMRRGENGWSILRSYPTWTT